MSRMACPGASSELADGKQRMLLACLPAKGKEPLLRCPNPD